MTKTREAQPGYDPSTFWNARLAAHYNLSGVGYLELGLAFNKWLYRRRRQVFLETVHSIGADMTKANVLDVGCGTGFYVDIWQTLGIKSLLGLDIAEVAIEALRQRYPVYEFVQGDIANQNLALEKRFHIVTLLDVVFHIVDDKKYEAALANIAHTVDSGGWLLISDLSFENTSAPVGDPHFRPRPLAEHIGAMDRAGFEFLGYRPIFFLMHPPLDLGHTFARIAGKAYWKVVVALTKRSELLGHLLGAILFAIDQQVGKVFRRGPSLKLLIFKKRGPR